MCQYAEFCERCLAGRVFVSNLYSWYSIDTGRAVTTECAIEIKLNWSERGKDLKSWSHGLYPITRHRQAKAEQSGGLEITERSGGKRLNDWEQWNEVFSEFTDGLAVALLVRRIVSERFHRRRFQFTVQIDNRYNKPQSTSFLRWLLLHYYPHWRPVFLSLTFRHRASCI